jgi:hypothetical protein
MLVAPLAGAQTITTQPVEHLSNDVVVLKDGTTLRGAVHEMTPNQSLTIVLENGQSRTIEWKDIERVDIDRAKAPPTLQVVTQTNTTMVHVDGPPEAHVQTLDARGSENAWVDVCRGACDVALRSDGLYRIDAPGIRASHPFRIEGPRADLHVNTASSAGFVGGLALVIAGGLFFVNGLSLFVVAVLDEDIITQETHDNFFIAGGVVTGVGVAALITGALLLKGNIRTKVDGATTVRVPAWREFPAQPSSRFGAITFPALSGSF